MGIVKKINRKCSKSPNQLHWLFSRHLLQRVPKLSKLTPDRMSQLTPVRNKLPLKIFLLGCGKPWAWVRAMAVGPNAAAFATKMAMVMAAPVATLMAVVPAAAAKHVPTGDARYITRSTSDLRPLPWWRDLVSSLSPHGNGECNLHKLHQLRINAFQPK